MILNFHTHSSEKEEGVIKFYNADIRKGEAELLLGDYRCAGIHPWWINNVKDFSESKELLLNGDILCIGEIGLDRSFKKIDFDVQIEFFKFQLEIALEREDQFVIIHCVKAYQEILNFVKEIGYEGKLIFHDYNGNEEMTEKLLTHGHSFSYGNMLFNKNSKAMRSLKSIPLSRLFIETDDHTKFSIEEAYAEASSFLDISTSQLSEQCMMNFKSLL